MRPTFLAFVLAFAACQLAQPGCDVGPPTGPSLVGAVCTTTLACADSPCTPGCTFVPGTQLGCPTDAPEAIASFYLDTCPQACGGGTSGYCYRIDTSQATCSQTPTCGAGYPQSCYEIGETFGDHEIVVCQTGESCHEDDVVDAGASCDLSTPDALSELDLATVD
jgi:hypothetical protein